MTSTFPAALDALSNPLPTNSQLELAHSAQHANLNDAMEAIQSKVGIDNSTDPDSHDYKLGGLLGVGAATTGSALLQHLPLETGALAVALRNYLTKPHGVPVTNFASDAALAVDATAAVVAAITAARALGKNAVYFPGGRTYKFAVGSAAIDPGVDDIVFYGDGWSSVMHFDEGTATGSILLRKNLFVNTADVTKGRLVFRDFQIRGNWSQAGYPSMAGGTPFLLDHYKELVLENLLLTNLASYVTVCAYNQAVRVTGCTFDTNARDNARFRSTHNVQIIGNRFLHSDDDAVALHCEANDTGADIREGIVVADNIFEDTNGIKILAGRVVSVRGNILRRCKQYAIGVYSNAGAASEANSAIFGVDISNNQIYDQLGDSPHSSPCGTVIGVFSRDAEGGSGTGSVIPGQPAVATGVFVKPWDWRNGTYSSTVDGVAAPAAIRVCGNIIKRTLPAVAAYATWGYGDTICETGPSNPAITDAALQPSIGILVSGQARKVLVDGNVIEHVGTPVYFDQPKDNFCMDRVRVTNNVLADFQGEAVFIATPSAVRVCDLLIANNDIDGDPLHRHANRKVAATTDGSWLADSTPRVFNATSIHGARIEFNRISNVCGIYNGPTVNTISVRGNILRANPSATGFSTSNKGIGNCPVAGPGYDYELVDSDPTSATYRALVTSSTLAREASAQPSSGNYVAGQIVWNNTGSGATVAGWRRLTTGSAHVAGTDWKTIALT